jgi:hypothetical protein
MLEAARREMTELSKKKQDGIVNTLKIKMLNRLLNELSKVIENDPSSAFVDMLDEETLPQNSDAVLVLSQWQAALRPCVPRAGLLAGSLATPGTPRIASGAAAAGHPGKDRRDTHLLMRAGHRRSRPAGRSPEPVRPSRARALVSLDGGTVFCMSLRAVRGPVGEGFWVSREPDQAVCCLSHFVLILLLSRVNK